MKTFDELTAALDHILLLRSRWDHDHWTSFQIDRHKLAEKKAEITDLYATNDPAWKRQDRKQSGRPNASAVSSPVLRAPEKVQIILMATPQLESALHLAPWAREKWSNRPIEFGSYVMVREPRQRGDWRWTWRLQPRVIDGLHRYMTTLVKVGNASAVAVESNSWIRNYTLCGGVRSQLIRLLAAASKLWRACHASPWPGLSPDELPMKIGFRPTKLREADSQ